MRAVFGFVGILIVAAIGFVIYSKQATSVSGTGTSPTATIEITGVQSDLVAIAQAEKRHFASEGKYVSIDDLISAGDINERYKKRGPYQYNAEVRDDGFRITATSDANDGNPRQLSIDETMQIKRE